MNCPYCNNNIEEGAQFCAKCGTRVAPAGQAFTQDFGAPTSFGAASSGVLKKNNTVLVAIIAIIIVMLIGGLVFFILGNSDAKRLSGAFSSTFGGKSWVIDCELSGLGLRGIRLGSRDDDDRKTISVSVESAADGEDSFFCASSDLEYFSGGAAYYHNALYFGGDDSYEALSKAAYEELNDKNGIAMFEALQKAAEHDLVGAVKTYDTEGKIESAFGNYNDAPGILKKMAIDFFKDEEKCKFVKNYNHDGNIYNFTIDIYELFITAHSDYGMELSERMLDMLENGYDGVNIDLTVKLDGKYVSSIEASIYRKEKTDDALAVKLTFSNVNKVSFEGSNTSEFIEKCKANGADPDDNSYIKKIRLKTANAYAKTVYNAMAERMADAETRGYSLEQVFTDPSGEYYIEEGKVFDADQEYDSIAGRIARIMRENGGEAGYFKVCRANINGMDTFAVFWADKEDSEIVGRYPDATTWESYKNAGSNPDIGGISVNDYQ